MYVYVDDAHHSHVTLTKFANYTITLYQQRLHVFVAFKRDLIWIWCTLALPEVLKPKEERIRQLF